MTSGNIMACAKQVNLFMTRFCLNDEARFSMPDYFSVSVDVYEDYAPGQVVYGWVNKGKLLRDSGVMFKVEDNEHKLDYYPIFPRHTAMSMLKHWQMPIPKKWSVFASGRPQTDQPVNPLNQEMRNLLAYARLFACMQQRYSTPMPYGFKEIAEQLHEYPEQAVDGDVVVLINKVISQYLFQDGAFLSCQNLHDFINYLHLRYTLLDFIDHDFSQLRELMKKNAPSMRCYF